MDELLQHPWPGNVRELEHVIQRAVALTSGDIITHFAFAPQGRPLAAEAAESGSGLTLPLGITVDEATRRLVEATVAQCGGNKLQAARILGIPPRTMYRHFGGPRS